MRRRALVALILLLAIPALAVADQFDHERQVALATYGDVCDVGTLGVPIVVGAMPVDHPEWVAYAHHEGDAPFQNCYIAVSPAVAFAGEYRCRVVAGHEFGHLAGLDHSSDPASIMWAFTLGFWAPCAADPIAMAASTGNRYPPGCLRQSDVNIGYYPFRVAHRTMMRVAPDDGALARQVLAPRRRFAVQSLPNPEHLSDPGMPEPVDGWVWGYAKRGGKSGWVRASALTADDPDSDPWAYGPAGIDFQAGVDFPDDDTPAKFTLGRAVTGRARVTALTVYLRHAPFSSPKGLLVRGEVVALLWRSGGSYCAEAGGVRGWLPRTAVRVG